MKSLYQREDFSNSNHQDELKIYAHREANSFKYRISHFTHSLPNFFGIKEIEQSGSIREISLVSICVSGSDRRVQAQLAQRIERKNHDLCKFLFSQSEKEEE